MLHHSDVVSVMNKNHEPKYLVIYRCGYCNQDSGYTDNDKPACRFCERIDRLTIVSKKRITAEVVQERLKVIVDNIMDNLTKAFEELPYVADNMVHDGTDAEIWLLRLMDKAQKLRDKVYDLNLKRRKR